MTDKEEAAAWKRECEMYANAWSREIGEARTLTHGWNKHHRIDALVVVTRDVVAEIQRLRKEVAELRTKVNREYRASIGEVWHWQGDGHDDLDSLVCPILIEPDQMLRELLRR
jgi:hypothetical protein